MSYCPACSSEYPDAWKRCPTDEAELLSSRNIGKYRVDSIIGAGGMGAVYKAFNPDTQAAVAIKLMHAEASSVEASRARFQREAAAVSALRTRHLCSIYDFGSLPDGTMFLVMEYLEGHNLRPEIRSSGSAGMPPQRINLVIDHSLRGLASAHKNSIVHRDLKPENIFIADTEDGDVAKVLDFGIAQVKDTSEESVLTKEGALMGTPAYMAPEQVGGNRGDIGAYTDVYAMGVIVYEMFTGVAPFEDESVTAILSKVLTRDFKPLRSTHPHLPAAVLDLVDCAMSDHFDDRFADAGAMREAWQAAYRTFDPTVQNAQMPAFRLTRDHKEVVLNTPMGTPDPLMATEYPESVSPEAAVDTRSGAFGSAATFASPAQGVPRPAIPTAQSQPMQTPATVGHSPGSTPRAPRKGGSGLWIALTLMVLAGGGATAFLLTRGGGDDDESKRLAGPTPSQALDAGAATGGLAPTDASAVVKPPNTTLGQAEDATAASPALPTVPEGMVALAAGSHALSGWPALELAAFYLDKTELTVAQYREALRIMKKDSAVTGADNQPVHDLSWNDARDACAALGKRLPTEHEWEYAATRDPRDPTGARLNTGGVKTPAAVGTHAGDCSPEGLCDMLGNVSEWTASPWQAKPKSKPDARKRVYRGGSFSVAPGSRYAKAQARSKAPTDTKDAEIGFRCARDREE